MGQPRPRGHPRLGQTTRARRLPTSPALLVHCNDYALRATRVHHVAARARRGGVDGADDRHTVGDELDQLGK